MPFTLPPSFMEVSFRSTSSKNDSGPETDQALADKYCTHRSLPQNYGRRLFRCPQNEFKVKWLSADRTSRDCIFIVREDPGKNFAVYKVVPGSTNERHKEREVFRINWEKKREASQVIYRDDTESYTGSLKDFLGKKGVLNKDYQFSSKESSYVWKQRWQYDTAATETSHWVCSSKEPKAVLATTERLISSRDGRYSEPQTFPLYVQAQAEGLISRLVVSQEILVRLG